MGTIGSFVSSTDHPFQGRAAYDFPQHPIDEAVMPFASAEDGLPEPTFALKAAVLQCPLLSEVVRLSSGPDSMGRCRAVSVVSGRANPERPVIGLALPFPGAHCPKGMRRRSAVAAITYPVNCGDPALTG